MRLKVQIEINGKFVYIGDLKGNDYNDACFSYDDEYLRSSDSKPISLSLPLNVITFDSIKTRNFFDGLLPEGFIRRSVAEELNVDINDYISILSKLGKECLGAIKITDGEIKNNDISRYRLLSQNDIADLAHEGTTMSAELVTKAHLSLTGASGKVGLYYDENKNNWYLPTGDLPSTHIVKQSHVRLKKIVANEQLCLLTARNLGIEIPESFIVQTENKGEEILFATKRYDRKIDESCKTINGLKVPYRLHQEDFAQALGISSLNKYEVNNDGYFKKAIDLIRYNFSNPLIDINKMWSLCVFNFLIGNTDNHIKNISLVYSENLSAISLAPAYDIICTTMYEESSDNLAYSIGGKYNINQINKEDFIKESFAIGLNKNIAIKIFNDMLEKFIDALKMAEIEMNKQGYADVKEISKAILNTGGIKNFI